MLGLFYDFLFIFKDLKAKFQCHPARCLLPVEIMQRCGLATWSSYCGATAIFIDLLIR